MNIHKSFILNVFILTSLSPVFSGCTDKKAPENTQRAKETLDAIYKHYGIPNKFLLRETFPFNESYTATYLAGDENAGKTNPYSYLWPFSGSLSAVCALFEATQDKRYKQLFDEKVLPGLEAYFDTKRSPHAYASYISTAPQIGRAHV